MIVKRGNRGRVGQGYVSNTADVPSDPIIRLTQCLLYFILFALTYCLDFAFYSLLENDVDECGITFFSPTPHPRISDVVKDFLSHWSFPEFVSR